MITPPPAPAPSATRERWERKARWMLPLGCLGCLIIAGGIALCAATLVYGWIRTSDPVRLALAAANSDKHVVEVLGAPVSDRLFITGATSTNGPSGRADFAVPVKGPKGEGTVFAIAAKSVGAWSLQVAVLEVASTRERIDLLHEPTPSPAPTQSPAP